MFKEILFQKPKNFITRQNSKKINKIADCISNVSVKDDSVLIEFNKNLFFYIDGHQVFYSKGQMVIKGQFLHFNPELEPKDEFDETNTSKSIESKLKNSRKANFKPINVNRQTLKCIFEQLTNIVDTDTINLNSLINFFTYCINVNLNGVLEISIDDENNLVLKRSKEHGTYIIIFDIDGTTEVKTETDVTSETEVFNIKQLNFEPL